MPSVSIILPARNAAKTIASAVSSILEQTWKDFELVVVNDGSIDQTANVIDRFNDKRTTIINTENKGVSAAANLALKHSQGRWIARMDADDYSHPQRIEKQLEWIRAHDLDAVGCQIRILDYRGEEAITMMRYSDWINQETLDSESISALRFVELPLVNPSILARREYFELGFREDELPEDYDLFLRAAKEGMKFGKVPEVLFDWYENPLGLTRTHSRYSTKAFDRCRKKYLLLGPLRNVTQVDLWGAGQTGKPWLRWLKSQKITVRRLVDVNSRKIGQKIHGCIVRSPEELERPSQNVPLLIAVGRAGARAIINKFIVERGFVSGQSAWFVA